MSEETNPEGRPAGPPASKGLRPPWRPGQSGNPRGRPRIEPRVRRHARKYDRRMCRVLAQIAMDVTVAPSERRRAAMDLIAVGSGRPALVQEVVGQGGNALGPLVNFNIGMGRMLEPEQAYRAFVEGSLPIEPALAAIQGRPVIDAQADAQRPGAAIAAGVEGESGSVEAGPGAPGEVGSRE